MAETTTTKPFHLGDLLSVSTEVLVSPNHIYGVAEILNWMTGDSLFTHQLPRANDEAKGPLLEQHPWLADIEPPGDGVIHDEASLHAWLAPLVEQYGETHEVAPLAADDHTHIDPLTELKMKRPDADVIVVRADGA